MDLLTILFIALGLSMDAVVVSLASGCSVRKVEALGGVILIAIGVKILVEHLRGG
jgi:putative Mn2+ efflux pump MntP